MMYSFNPANCSPLGWSDINNTYVEDKDSGGFFVLNAETLVLSIPIRYGDDENNEWRLMSLVKEAIDWMDILRSTGGDQWPAPVVTIQDDPLVSKDFTPRSYSHYSHLMTIQDEISGATVIATSFALTITMPVVSEDSLYFVNEHRLMRLSSEALETINSQRRQREIDSEKAAKVALDVSEAAD